MVMEQLDGKDMEDLEHSGIQPINLGMPILKEVGVKWLVGMAEYISDKPLLIVNGFVRSWITSAIDRVMEMGSESDDSGTKHTFHSDFDTSEISDDELCSSVVVD